MGRRHIHWHQRRVIGVTHCRQEWSKEDKILGEKVRRRKMEKWIIGRNERLPWEPIPGRGTIQIRSKIYMPEIDTGDILDEPQVREPVPRRVKIGRTDLIKYGSTIGCPGCIAQNRGGTANHNERCRDRIEKLIMQKEPERYDKTLTRLVERQVKRQDEKDRKRRREEEVQEKIKCEKCGAEKGYIKVVSHKDKDGNETSGKYCVPCAKDIDAAADVTTSLPRKSVAEKRKFEEAATGHIDTPMYKEAKRDKEEGDNMEEDKNKRQREEEPEEAGKLRKTEGESRGVVEKEMDVDAFEEDQWTIERTNMYENKMPIVNVRGKNIKRTLQACSVQEYIGELYICEIPLEENDKEISAHMKKIGGKSSTIGNRKIWTNSKKVVEKKMASTKDEDMRKVNWGRLAGEGFIQELKEREREEWTMMEVEEARYMDDEGKYWDEVSNKQLEREGVIMARKEEKSEFRKHGVYIKVKEEECWKETGKAPIRVRWIDINKGDENNKEYRSRLVAQEIK